MVQCLKEEKRDSGELNEMYLVSQSHLLESEGEFAEAYRCLTSLNTSASTSLGQEIISSATESALRSGDACELITIAKADSSAGAGIVDAVIDDAGALNYKAFKCLDQFISSNVDSALKSKCADFLNSATETRPKSFLIGTWEWQSDDETKEQIEVKANKDNLIGYVKVVGTSEQDFHIQQGEILWTDFVFMDASSLTFSNLCKTQSGLSVNATALVTIDYAEDDYMHQHVTAPAPYSMAVADIEWLRLE